MTELESTTANTYQVPTSPEASLNFVPKQPLTETELARAAAMEQAVSGLHELNTADVDAHRIEGIGASTVAAAIEGTPAAQPEIFFDPADMAQQIACGRGAVFFRTEALRRDGVRIAAQG